MSNEQEFVLRFIIHTTAIMPRAVYHKKRPGSAPRRFRFTSYVRISRSSSALRHQACAWLLRHRS